MQTTAQAQSLELDKLSLITDVTKKTAPEEFTAAAKGIRIPSYVFILNIVFLNELIFVADGTYISGLYLEGGSWNMVHGVLENSKPREMFVALPVIHIKASVVDKIDNNVYLCPVYKTQRRGPTYVFSLQLKSKFDSGKWTLAGVVSIMDIL